MPQLYAPPVAYKPESGVGGCATLLGEPFYSVCESSGEDFPLQGSSGLYSDRIDTVPYILYTFDRVLRRLAIINKNLST
jgi:hypothetical protein